MAVMSEDVKKLFEEVPTIVFCTASLEGQPNGAPVGMKKVIDDETVYVSDQFFKKTLSNVQANTKVSLVFWGEGGAYQIHGTARYVNDGAAFAAMGAPIVSKGGCFIHVDAVYTSQPGPTAGDRIA